MSFDKCLKDMSELYVANPVKAVRSQKFIKTLHGYIAEEMEARLTARARKEGIQVLQEESIHGAFKAKDMDVAVIHPKNGPLMLVGVRSQMSSIGKNALTYYQDILGECKGLQEKFPSAIYGYVYLHPLRSIKPGLEKENIRHDRWAKLYASFTGRKEAKDTSGKFDQFAYMVVDFNPTGIKLMDELIHEAVPTVDMAVSTFVDRMVKTYQERFSYLDYFK